jgi:hypothetical protein
MVMQYCRWARTLSVSKRSLYLDLPIHFGALDCCLRILVSIPVPALYGPPEPQTASAPY